MNEMFRDLVVVELASVLAGPAVGMFFAELGAKVIKIENKNAGGDVTRTWKIKNEKQEGPAAYYHSVNYNKESVFLNLKDTADQAECLKIIEKADIVISNFSDQVAESLGVSYNQLKDLYPALIYTQLYGFAAPSTRAAYDIVLQAETGFLSMSGTKKGKLTRMPVALIDVLAAHQLKEGILIALIKKIKSGKGSLVSTSLEESAISSLANQATNYLMVDSIPRPMGTGHPNIAPYGDIFLSLDTKKLVLAIGTDKQFLDLCVILGDEGLAKEEAFCTNDVRVENRSALKDRLKELIRKWQGDDLLEACLSKKIPIGKVNNMEQVFQSEVAKDMVLSQNEADGSISKRVKTIAFKVKDN